MADHSIETRPEEADDDLCKFIPMGATGAPSLVAWQAGLLRVGLKAIITCSRS
jgi:hypothetical protein